MEMELENIIAEAVADDFCKEYKCKTMENKVDNNGERVNMVEKNAVKVCKTSKHNINDNEIVNECKDSIAKSVLLMGATAVCAYFKLMSPILYIPIEIACICAVSYKCGEWKGSVANG